MLSTRIAGIFLGLVVAATFCAGQPTVASNTLTATAPEMAQMIVYGQAVTGGERAFREAMRDYAETVGHQAKHSVGLALAAVPLPSLPSPSEVLVARD